MAALCGDGGFVEGGIAHKHRGASLKDIWGALENRNLWDLFHLIDKSGSCALKGSAMAELLFDVLKRLERIFGLGQGRYLDRAVAAFLNLPHAFAKRRWDIERQATYVVSLKGSARSTATSTLTFPFVQDTLWMAGERIPLPI